MPCHACSLSAPDSGSGSLIRSNTCMVVRKFCNQNLSFKLFSLSCMFANNTSSRVQTGRAYLTSLRSHPITHSENLVQFRRHIIILCLLLKSLSADHPQQDLKDRCLEILSSIREILKTLVVPCQGLDHQLERCPEITGTRLS